MIKVSYALLILTLAFSTIPSYRIPRETLTPDQSLSLPFSLPATGDNHFPAKLSKPDDTHHLYLPQVLNPDTIWQDQAIWAHRGAPAAHEVALFRHKFTLDANLDDAELHIFADTRYEVWVDGSWVGRGPARFSRNLHEYDVYPLGVLLPGVHLLAVQVQWAPNTRRSESLAPHLIGHIQGANAGVQSVHASTGGQWKCQLSPAWRQDAAPVHSWQLIGPTELLGLRRLPEDWNQPAFDDRDWPNAETVPTIDEVQGSAGSPGGLAYQPRSLDPMEYRPLTPNVIDAGLLSPNFLVGEITPPLQDPYTLSFTQTLSTVFTVEALFGNGSPTNTIRLDGEKLQWQDPTPDRPDVVSASTELASGEHSISFEDMPASGMTFAVSAQNSSFEDFPFSQGVHAGRRLLLAKPASQPEVVKVNRTPALELQADTLPAYVVLDLGRAVHGRLSAQVSGPAGSIIDIGWDERLYGDNRRPLPFPGSMHPEWNQVDSWILDGIPRTISTIDARAGRYILIAVWGKGIVMIDAIQVFEEGYPITRLGSFVSSDPLLNRIWQVGVDTLIPNMTDAYTDTPWRERGQWWGDAYIADHINRVATGDVKLLKRGLRDMANSFDQTGAPGMAPNSNNTHMLDYAMLWVSSLSEYIQLTGDRQFLRETYPVVQRFLEHLSGFENPATGLLDLPKDHWSRFAFVDSLGYSSRYGQSTAINSSYYHALQQAAYLADERGDLASAQAWRQRAQSVRDQINQLLFLPDQHSFGTTVFQGEMVPPTPHAQAWALAYDLPTENGTDEVATSLVELLSTDPDEPNLEIFGMFWVLEALGRSGHSSQALEIIDNYYTHILSSGTNTWWEVFNADKLPAASYSHVWGGSPTWFLSTYILGAKWAGPGTWQVSPALEGVSFVSGNIPLDTSMLNVSWQRPTCRQASLMIQSDDATSGEVIIPVTWPIAQVRSMGQTVWQPGNQDSSTIFMSSDGLHLRVSGGSHSLDIEYQC